MTKTKPKKIPSEKLRFQVLAPDTSSVLGRDIPRGVLTVKNWGPSRIKVQNGYGPAEMTELEAGQVRLIRIYGKIEVENAGDHPTAFEFAFVLMHKN